MIFGFIVCMAVGLLCIIVGIVIWTKQKLALIHDYLVENIRKEDVPAYTKQIGAGMILIGAGCCAMGASLLLERISPGLVGMAIGILIGTIFLVRAQIRYGGEERKNTR